MSKAHPVWDVYDEFRTARLNVRYYETRLERHKTANMWMDILIAVSASSNVAGLLWLQEYLVGMWVFRILAAITAILAVIKPFLKLPDKIRLITEILTGYKILDNDLQMLSIFIRQHQKYDDDLKQKFSEALQRRKTLAQKEGSLGLNKKLRRQCQQDVKRELPVDHFFVPAETN